MRFAFIIAFTAMVAGLSAKQSIANELLMLCDVERGSFELLTSMPGGTSRFRFQFPKSDLTSATPIEIGAGETQECHLGSNRRIRLKTTVEQRLLNGPCAAAPDLLISLWIDERQVFSARSYASRCEDKKLLWYVQIERADTEVLSCTLTREIIQSRRNYGTVAVQEDCWRSDLREYPVDEAEFPSDGGSRK